MNDLNNRFPCTVQKVRFHLAHNLFHQVSVRREELAGAHIAGMREITIFKVLFRQREGAGVGIGIAGDLTGNPIPTTGIRKYECGAVLVP